MTETHLYVIKDDACETIGLGPRQAIWLEHGGFIERTDQPPLWRALQGLTIADINDLVMSQPALRECDFCRTIPAGWRINCRSFKLKVGLNAGGRMGGAERPLFACDVCVRYVRENRKRELVDYAIASTVEHAKTVGGHVADVANSQPWAVIKPIVRDVVFGMFSARIGYPERDDDSSQDRDVA